MPLLVAPAEVADFPRLAALEKAAFATDPYTRTMFPGPFPDGFRAKQIAEQARDDKTARIWKVVDTDLAGDDQIIAYARWHVWNPRPELPPRDFGPGCNPEACKAVFGGLAQMRLRLLADRPCVYLQILVTDPKHHRRGAGRMLMEAYMAEAVQLGLPAYLESSVVGHKLYLSCGFRDWETQELDMSLYGDIPGKHVVVGMGRDFLPPEDEANVAA